MDVQAPTQVKASQVLAGDRLDVVIGTSSKTMTVSTVTPGIIRGCVSLNYTDGNWSEVPKDEPVLVIRQEAVS